MKNKPTYQAIFSYDLSQTGKKNYDFLIKKQLERIDGALIETYSDDYGVKELTFNITNQLTTVNQTLKNILEDFNKQLIKLNITVSRAEFNLLINKEQFKNNEKAIDILTAKQEDFLLNNKEENFELTFLSEENRHMFIKEIIPVLKEYTENKNTVLFETNNQNSLINHLDNYITNKKNHSI